jgi:hypothetical protein
VRAQKNISGRRSIREEKKDRKFETLFFSVMRRLTVIHAGRYGTEEKKPVRNLSRPPLPKSVYSSLQELEYIRPRQAPEV